MLRLVLTVSALACLAVPAFSSLADEQRLLNDLLVDYNKRLFNKPVNVEIGMSLLRILDLDIEKNVVRLDVWMEYYWEDVRLRWNPADYGNVKSVTLPSTDVWVPDVIPYNSADDVTPVAGPVSLTVFHDGHVMYIPPRKLNFYCNLRGYLKSHSRNMVCQLKMGSWAHSADKLNLGLRLDHVGVSDYDPSFSQDVELVSTEARVDTMKYACCEEEYQTAKFVFTFSL